MFADSQFPLADGSGQESTFLELGINRLARDLFLLTAACALFIVMFVSASFSIAARNSWAEEGRASRSRSAGAARTVLVVHLRRDGRIQVGDRLLSSPREVEAAVRGLIEENPKLREARVVLNTWRETPSIRTSDVASALRKAGLGSEKVHLRFTEE
jgi:hypothetical protein